MDVVFNEFSGISILFSFIIVHLETAWSVSATSQARVLVPCSDGVQRSITKHESIYFPVWKTFLQAVSESLR